MNKLQAALALASKGKTVFPCRQNGKEPLTPRGFKDATTDPVIIGDWWAQNPDANLAIATGEPSGVVVLDVDVDPGLGKDGERALAGLVGKWEPLPLTLTARTPRGGRHIYFRHPGSGMRVPCSTDKLGAGLDIRADGGYVLVPPSCTERGNYAWESTQTTVASLPSWLLELLSGASAKNIISISNRPAIRGNGNPEQKIREALQFIPASSTHHDWVRVLMALHDWDPFQGKALGRDWSATCPQKFNEISFETAWRSFKPGGGVSLGTLFEMARQHGWCSAPPSRGRWQATNSEEDDVSDVAISKWPEPPRSEAFYGPIGEFVRRLDPYTESDQMALLMQALAGFGNLVGRKVHFEVEADTHCCNLNVATVGSSSKARKGTAWGHVSRLLRKIDPSWPRFITGLSTGEGLIACVRDPVIKKNKEGEEVLEDEGVRDKRLLVVESEFGRTLQCANREGNTLSAVVRQAFDTGDLRVAVKGSPQVSTGAHISIIGHITVVELNLLLTKSDCSNGFANRFLWAAVRRSKLLPEGGNAGSLDFSDIVARLSEAVKFAKAGGCLSRDDAATELWRNIYVQLSGERPGLLGAVISRGEAMVMRLAMILAAADCSPTIQRQHLRAAIAIWDYCENSAAFIFGDSLGNPTAERVLKLLQEAGEHGLPLTRIYAGLSGHLEKEELHTALKQLHGQGLAECQKVKTSGRPGQVWFVTKAASERSEQSEKKVASAETVIPTPTGIPSSLNSLNSPPQAWEETI